MRKNCDAKKLLWRGRQSLVACLGVVVFGFHVAAAAVVCPTADQIVGLNGKVGNVQVVAQAADTVQPVASVSRGADIDLRRMAEWSMLFLTRTPRPHLNYEPVFQLFPYRCPPAPEGTDPVVACDTDVRMDLAWYLLRDITGSKMGMDVEQAFHQRMRSFVDQEGIVWCHPGAYNEGNTTAVYEKKDEVIHMWGAAKMLQSLSEDYARTHRRESKAQARKVMLALKKLMHWDAQGRCWSPCGNGCLDANRQPLPNPLNIHPLPIVEPLIRYHEIFGDQEALDFAKAYAEGMIAGVQPGGVRFGTDGSFDAHSHITLHSVWGVAHLGCVTGDVNYTEWSKRVFDFFLKARGTGTGWFAAAPGHPTDETCCVADVISLAAYIARGGHAEYYDYVERYVRNRITPAQFILTPEIRAHYSELNSSLGAEKIHYGLSELEKYQGGFLGGTGLNDWENVLLNRQVYGNGPEISMIGCCQGSGMRAISTVWNETIAKLPRSPLGPAGVYVNLSFNRTSPWGEVFSFMPDQGRLTVKAAVRDTFFVRVPKWASRDRVKAFLDCRSIPVEWSGDYVRFRARKGQELTVAYPMIGFEQTITTLLPSAPSLNVTFAWRGNMILSSTPRAERTALFTGGPRVLPPAPRAGRSHADEKMER
jgi:hypothetical protein